MRHTYRGLDRLATMQSRSEDGQYEWSLAMQMVRQHNDALKLIEFVGKVNTVFS